MAFVLFSIAIGAACALFHQRVFMLLSLSALVAAVAVLGGITAHAHLWVIAVEALGVLAALQLLRDFALQLGCCVSRIHAGASERGAASLPSPVTKMAERRFRSVVERPALTQPWPPMH